MTTKICRVCLSTNKSLRELDKHLSDYILEICNNAIESSKYQCCTTCEDSLKNNLDFRNKCRKSYQIFQEWIGDNRQEKLPIESLSKLLQESSNQDKYEIFKCEKSQFSNHVKKTSADLNDFKEDIFIKVELINEQSALSEDDNEIENDQIQNISDISNRDIPVSKKNVKSKTGKKEKSRSQIKNANKVPTKYKLRGEIAKRSEFTQYEAVFDIILFATYADARKELMGRRVSEPYVSARFRCELCYTVYKNEGLLLFHMKWHDPSPELTHECDVCSMRFSSRSTLLKHKPNCHRGKFACKMCPLVTYQRQAMKAHFQKHQGKIYKCHCDRVFKHISSYMTHKRNVHTSAHVCVACARTFVSELGLRDHTLKMHPAECKVDIEAAVRCEPCALTFASQQVYTVHVLNTDEHKDIAGELIACSVCGLAFDEMSQVKEHKRLYHARTQKPNLRRSMDKKNCQSKKDSTKDREKISDIIECKLCGSTGGSHAWLYQHYRRDHPAERYEAPRGQREFLCDQCGKGFYKKLQLMEHVYVHSGLKPFRCETCHKAFRTKMSLKNHSERHAPPSRECPHCGKKFNSAANLSNHIRSHTGDRRFVCPYCSKGFLHRAALREHVRGVHLHIRRQRKPMHK